MECEREDGELEEGELDDDDDDTVTNPGISIGTKVGTDPGETGELSDDNSVDDKPTDRLGELPRSSHSCSKRIFYR